MNSQARDQLFGYLMGALEPSEEQVVADKLRIDPALERGAEIMRRSLAPLECDFGHDEPPIGLAQRTCEHVARQAGAAKTTVATSPVSNSAWRWIDMAVAASILFVAGLLLVPAVLKNRENARLAACQNNLRRIGTALFSYSERHGDQFPYIAAEGNLGVAGIFAPVLYEGGYLDQPELFVCPGSLTASTGGAFRIPSLAEIQAASGAVLQRLQRTMSGDYGYTFGYLDDGRYRPTRFQGRDTFALVSDAPNVGGETPASSHHGGAHCVLFEDGHVTALHTCNAAGCPDNFFMNDLGFVGAGRHRDDAVIAPSWAQPLLGTPAPVKTDH